MATGKDLLEKRAGLVEQARGLLDVAEKETRDATAEERSQFDAIMADVDKITDQADQALKLEGLEASLEETRGRQTPLETPEGGQPEEPEIRTVELRKSVCGDPRDVTIPQTADVKAAADSFRKYLTSGEHRALQKGDDTLGGYLSAPQQWVAELIQALDNLVFMREICRVLPPLATAESLGAPSLAADPADPTWTSELGTGSLDSTMSFGKRELKPTPLAQRAKISKTLIRRSTMSAEAIVRERLAYKNSVVLENVYMNGHGADQPLGVFTASDSGISTGQDVSTGNTATEIRFDGLIECEMSLPAQYRRNCNWIFHRTGVKQIRKLKDGEGRYIWQPSVIVGAPDTILNYPVRESEYAPSTFTTGLYVGLLGNFEHYWIVDALTLQIQTLVELYAETNQNGYISRLETDGMPVLEAAFARVKLA